MMRPVRRPVTSSDAIRRGPNPLAADRAGTPLSSRASRCAAWPRYSHSRATLLSSTAVYPLLDESQLHARPDGSLREGPNALHWRAVIAPV
jgi:hypothetical protein